MGRPSLASIATDTPTRVLDAAERAFSFAGLAGAKLADIASAAGIRRPSLLYHFASKQGLYDAVVERGFDELGAVLGDAMNSEGDFVTRLHRVQSTFVTFLDSRPHLARLVLRQMIDGESPGQKIIRERVVPLVDRVEGWIVTEAGAQLRADAPVRDTILQFCSNVLLRSASGELRASLWPTIDSDWSLVLGALFPDDARPRLKEGLN